jgi:spore germination cell wall hydrolase CwlJ-like protein
MVALRDRPLAAFSVSFWLSALCAALAPTSIGYQDLAAYLARQPGVSERWRDHLIASPFGTIHAATFSFSRPIGTTVSDTGGSAQTINFDPRSLDVKVWFGNNSSPLVRPPLQVAFPSVNRRLKGDRMAAPVPASTSSGTDAAPLQPIAPAVQPASPLAAPASSPNVGPRPKSAGQRDGSLDLPLDAFGSLPRGLSASEDVTGSLPPAAVAAPERDAARDVDTDDDAFLADKPPEIPSSGESGESESAHAGFSSQSFLNENPAERNAQIYFGGGVMGARSGLEQWPLGAAPVVVARTPDPEIKQSALEAPLDPGPGGESVAGKDDAAAPQGSPAERLGLEGRERAKAEKCLADAVYFEARGEELRGQMAVAQVVMNRVFSGYYPNNVCGVVYQNANRHLRCQFTFACEGKDLSKVDELDMWEQAKTIAKDMLDGKIWLSEVGHATHYHAYWVHPSWVHEMKKMYRLGVHTFYRPRAWADVPEGPVWSSVPIPTKSAAPSVENPDTKEPPAPEKTPEAVTKVPQAAASPGPEAGAASAPL